MTSASWHPSDNRQDTPNRSPDTGTHTDTICVPGSTDSDLVAGTRFLYCTGGHGRRLSGFDCDIGEGQVYFCGGLQITVNIGTRFMWALAVGVQAEQRPDGFRSLDQHAMMRYRSRREDRHCVNSTFRHLHQVHSLASGREYSCF